MSDKMQLLIEEASTIETLVVEEINEATGKPQKNYYIQGIFSTPDKKNRNGRIYSRKLWEENVQRYQEHIKNNTKYTLGELEHPSRVEPDPMLAVMKIVELKMEDGVVKGKAKILNDNSKETNKLKALIDEGYKIGVSSRGTGRMKGSIVEEFQLSTYDIVQNPSDYNAMLDGITESIEKPVYLNENTGYWVCDENGCSLQEHNTSKPLKQESPCKQKAKSLIETLTSFVQEEKELSESEKIAIALMEKENSDIKTIDKLLKDLRNKIKNALDNGAGYVVVDKLEKELKDIQTYLKNTGITESEDINTLIKEFWGSVNKIKAYAKQKNPKIAKQLESAISDVDDILDTLR